MQFHRKLQITQVYICDIVLKFYLRVKKTHISFNITRQAMNDVRTFRINPKKWTKKNGMSKTLYSEARHFNRNDFVMNPRFFCRYIFWVAVIWLYWGFFFLHSVEVKDIDVHEMFSNWCNPSNVLMVETYP